MNNAVYKLLKRVIGKIGFNNNIIMLDFIIRYFSNFYHLIQVIFSFPHNAYNT